MQTPYILPKVVFLCVLSDGTVMDLDDTGRKYLYSIAFVLGDYWKALAVELIRECTKKWLQNSKIVSYKYYTHISWQVSNLSFTEHMFTLIVYTVWIPKIAFSN